MTARGGSSGGAEAGARASAPIRIGISACLLGRNVRFDGGHKKDPFLTGTFSRYVEFVPVCPEVEVGMGTPREPIRLQRDGSAGVRLVGTRTRADHTDRMRRYAEARVEELARLDLCGYVLKKDSPSCGMERVRVYGGKVPARDGRGLFAAALLERLPLLPVEEEGRLNDERLREAFVERVFAYRRLRDLFAARWTVGDLVRFHSGEKLLLLAHDPDAYRKLGRVVAHAKGEPRGDVERAYGALYMGALAKATTRGRTANVLMHMAGYLKDLATPDERRELAEAIRDYRRGLLPLLVPLTLVKHHVRRHGIDYLAGQRYLEPHPKELMLRNHV